MKTEILLTSHEDALSRALQVLASGGLVAFPTETVYGLGADLFNEQALRRLYRVKGRGAEKALPVLIGDAHDLPRVAIELSPMATRLAQAFWPGPLTLVVRRQPSLPARLSPYATVGVRMPNHPFARLLLQKTGPLAVSSANRSGEPSAKSAAEVMTALGGRIELVLDGGECGGGLPSTVIDCAGEEPRLLRPGPIAMDDILGALR